MEQINFLKIIRERERKESRTKISKSIKEFIEMVVYAIVLLVGIYSLGMLVKVVFPN